MRNYLQAHRVLKPDGILIFGTMNRSWRSWLSLMWHTDILRDVPAGLFDWRLGIVPGEIKRIGAEERFNIVHEELQGICEITRWEVDWSNAPWVLKPHQLEFRECKDDTRYLGWAYKFPDPVADEAADGARDSAGTRVIEEEGQEVAEERTEPVADGGQKTEL
jgi:hypothetical protein